MKCNLCLPLLLVFFMVLFSVFTAKSTRIVVLLPVQEPSRSSICLSLRFEINSYQFIKDTFFNSTSSVLLLAECHGQHNYYLISPSDCRSTSSIFLLPLLSSFFCVTLNCQLSIESLSCLMTCLKFG